MFLQRKNWFLSRSVRLAWVPAALFSMLMVLANPAFSQSDDGFISLFGKDWKHNWIEWMRGVAKFNILLYL